MYRSYLQLCSMMAGMKALKISDYLLSLVCTFLTLLLIHSIQNLINLCTGAGEYHMKNLIGNADFAGCKPDMETG